MKSLVTATIGVILLNLLLAAAGVGYLVASDRLDGQRVSRIVDMLSITIAQQQRQEQEAANLAKEAESIAEQAAWMERVKQGPQTLSQRLAADQQSVEIANLKLARIEAEAADLKRRIQADKTIIARQKAELEAERKAFEEFMKQQTARMRDEDFLQTVKMYEQIKADQAKQMFQQLLAEGQTDQVVEYLAAMNQRKAAGVLKKFETPVEIQQAVELLERLRQRGVNPLANQTGPQTPETAT